MRPFLKAAEVWIPADDTSELRYGGRSYGSLTELRDLGRSKRLGCDRGLAGRSWAQGRPLLMSTDSSAIERTRLTRAAGITTGIAFPVVAGDYPVMEHGRSKAVVLMYG